MRKTQERYRYTERKKDRHNDRKEREKRKTDKYKEKRGKEHNL